MQRPLIILFLLFALGRVADAQNDTILSIKGQQLVGEIKTLEKGVLVFKTHYSDKDFNIEWDEIEQVKTNRFFLIILTDGRRLNGSVRSYPGEPPVVRISGDFGNLLIDDLLDIIYLKPVESNFLGRLDASIEIGYTFTKAKNHHQFNTRSSLGYLADTWGANASFDMNRSLQDSIEPTKRTEASIGYRTFFDNSWFLAISNNFLQNDEQKLKLRSTTDLSLGHFLINTYKEYWGVGAGLAFNYESFTSEEPNVQSLEALISSELNLFAYDDLSILSTLKVYPGITVWGRIRSDFKFDIKYDLPLDLFIKFGFSHNYDNQPTAGASKHDFIIQTTFGWEL